ncbi:MAG: exostosin family protein [Candidatus Kaiserbacteria bacterium]|nr:exostosin family protein [Candidatus Kaiserbacteria bacterium]
MVPIKPLIFYVNPAWKRVGIHTPLLNPWLGNPIDESSISKQMFDTYSFDTKYYAITDDLHAADMVLLPYPHIWCMRHDIGFFDECVRTAQTAGLPLLIDGVGDVEYPIDIQNAYILRYGGYRFLPERGRIQIPPLADDLLERYRDGQLDIRKKSEANPVVGFAGWVKLSPVQFLRTIVKELPVRFRGVFDTRYRACIKGVLWRKKAIKILQQSSLITFNLRARRSFSASSKTAEGDMQKLRSEMIDTILQSDYALDVRGDANDSTRLFEILSLGRIPVIVDTERNFPLSDKLDYSSFALIVDFRDLEYLPERIAEFHKNISPEYFEQMQRNARDAYIKYFRIDALTRSIIEKLQEVLASSKQS